MENHPASRTKASQHAKLIAFVLLWLVLIIQIAWMLIQKLHAHTPLAAMWYADIIVLGCFLVALTNGRTRWVAALLRLIVALAFLEALADRFGLLGGPGASGVAWGNFSRFVAYAGVVLSFLPHAMVPTLAVLATIAEIVFGITMLLGIKTRLASAGSAILLFLFATAMTISGLSQFSYAVYLLCVGALALATVDATFLSVDALPQRRRPIPA